MIKLIIPDLINNLNAVLPEIVLSITLVAIVVFDLIFNKNKKLLPYISIIGLVLTFIFLTVQFGKSTPAFSNSHNFSLLSLDGFSFFFKVVILITSFFVVLFSVSSKEIESSSDRLGEYYSLIFGMIIGMFFMVSANDLILIYLSLELLSLSSYVLAGFVKTSVRNSEASLKYLIYGSASSGIMLFGMSILYGISGSTNLDEINSVIHSPAGIHLTFLISVIMIFAGIGFKISIVPFHFWTPDVYEGAPITITAFLSVASKAAGFAVLIRFIAVTFVENVNGSGYWSIVNFIDWQYLLIIFSIITMTFGNFSALWQDNLKRMLAYSSIAHAGYLMLGVAVFSNQGMMAVLVYFFIYLFMNLGAFGIISVIEGEGETNLKINSYAGLGNRKPLLAGLLAVLMFALAGLPPFAGFFGKYYIFIAAIKAKLTWLAILGVISSAISVYFYLRIIVLMYFKSSDEDMQIQDSRNAYIAILISVILVILLGVFPGSFLDLITKFI